MNTRNVKATITYQENCDYQSSTLTCNLPVAIQTAQLNINVTNPHNEDRINTQNPNIFYYNDILDIQISVIGHNIQHGTITVYYIENDSIDKELSENNKITPIPLKVNDNGQVTIRYYPHKSGEIIAIYDGTPYYHIAEKRYQILLHKIPTFIHFLTEHPVLTYIEDDVELKVQVKDIYNNPVQYGMVTFLNEQSHDINNASDGTERVIGNPIMLNENGIGTIHYSPIQLFNKQKLFYYDGNTANMEHYNDDYEPKILTITDKNYTQLKKYYTFPNDFDVTNTPVKMFVGDLQDNDTINNNIELIKCIYNYDNKLYGVDWKYYESHSDYTNIAILLPDTLTIQATTLQNLNGNIYTKPLTSQSDNFLHLTTEDYCILKAKLLDIYGDDVSFDNDVEILFQIIGTQVTYTNNNYAYIPYKQNITGKFYKEYYGDTNVFIGDLTNTLPLGNYTIQAFLEPQKYNATEIIVNKIGTENDITNESYFQPAISPKIYITVDPIKGDTQNIKLNLQINNLSNIINVGELIQGNNIVVDIQHPFNDNTFLTFLQHNIAFYISNINKKYYAQIHENGECFTFGRDEDWTPISSLSFDSPDNYYIYCYIPAGQYIYEYTNNSFKEISLPTIYSNIISIPVRDILMPNISITKISETYPGNIQYKVSINNIFDENVETKIIIFKNNNIIKENTIILNRDNNVYNDILSNLSPGEYNIKATIMSNNNTINQTFTIHKASLSQNNDALVTTLTHPNQNIAIKLQSSNNVLTTLQNTLQGFIKFNDNITECNLRLPIDQNQPIIENNICYINLEAPLYEAGEYSVCVTYDGDDNFYPLNQNWDIKFNAIYSKGVINASYYGDDLLIRISTNQGHNGQYILGEMVFSNYNGDKKYIPIIFDANGEVIINHFTESMYEWQQYYMIEINLYPKNSNIINILKNATNPADSLINYYQNNNTHDFLEIQCEDIDIAAAMLKQQLNNADDMMIFTTYDRQKIIGEVDGTI